MYKPATGEITGTAELSDQTLETYVNLGEHVLLDVLGDPDVHYVVNNELVEYTEAERAARATIAPGWVWQMPERIAVDTRALADARTQAWNRIKAARDIAEVADFTHDGNVYQADRERINGAVTAAILAQMAGAPYSIDWTLSDNTTVTLDGAQMMAVGAALAQRVKEVFEVGVTRRAAIADAANPAAADAINWGG
jgi:hypothetical protein